ncbi:MAG TPA: BON domain-containing protein [Zeimonas sp.]|nr:BON domain-containing protein [Zeimonas sp.]
MQGPRPNDSRYRGEHPERRDDRPEREWVTRELHDPRTGERVAPHRAPGAYEPYSGAGRGRDHFDAGYGDDRGHAEPGRPGERGSSQGQPDREVDTRFTGRGYHYPGGGRYPEASGRRDARDYRPYENRSWDPDDRDAPWRRGEHGSRLYGSVVGAATPSGTAGIERYGHRAGAARRGPKGYVRSDERLRDDICERLSEQAWADLSEVEVYVQDGHVRLEGEVGDRLSKYAIEDVACTAWGAKDVENRIRVRVA